MINIQEILINSPYWIRQFGINLYGFFLAKRRFSKDFKLQYNKFNENLIKDSKEIEQDQFSLLKENLIYCYENIPYYKRIFDEVGFEVYKMNRIEEIKILPFLTKDIIRKEQNNLYNKSISKSKYKTHYTSGSTGEKLKFKVNKTLLYTINTSLMYRFYNILGIKPKDKRVTVGGRKFANRRPYYSFNVFENQLLISSHNLDDLSINSYIDRMNKFRPIFIQGHPSSILIISKYILKKEIEIKLNLKAISTTGETLFENDRKIIEKAFRTKVYQQYGSGENCFSAQELPDEKGYVINYEHGYIELVGEGNYKEVVVTSLQNKVMPFVRYKIGDFVSPVKKRYSEKYGLPILFDKVIGRIDDVLYNDKGESILPVSIRMSVKPYLKDGTNYQLIQEEKNNFVLRLLDVNKIIDIEKLSMVLKSQLGQNIKLKIIFINNITTQGGKVRNVINNMNKKLECI